MPTPPRAAAWPIAILLAAVLAACGAGPDPFGPTPAPAFPGASADAGGSADPGATRGPIVVPTPGHEIYGYLPYWEMDDESIVDHVAGTPLTTLGLFSVTQKRNGTLDSTTRGYGALTGDVGHRLVEAAHARGIRVELVWSSFGEAKNRRLLGDPAVQATVIAGLVALVGELGLDGVDVDIEALDPTLVPAYAQLVTDLRTAVRVADPGDRVSVATGAHALGAAMAAAASAAGADRIFLMGYDYRTGGSQPGATSPLDRADGDGRSLRTSLDLYLSLGVDPERLLLGLPLYGVAWPVAGPVLDAPSTGRGDAWFPRSHVELLTDPAITPARDGVEQVEQYLVASDGTVGAPSIEPGASPETRTWTAIYVDSPATLATKLALANERGLAGAGFWAIGYERGIDGYTRLMERFARGDALP